MRQQKNIGTTFFIRSADVFLLELATGIEHDKSNELAFDFFGLRPLCDLFKNFIQFVGSIFQLLVAHMGINLAGC